MNLPGGKKGHIGLTTLPPSVSRMSKNVGASTSRNPKDFHGLYRDRFTFIGGGGGGGGVDVDMVAFVVVVIVIIIIIPNTVIIFNEMHRENVSFIIYT
jgi:hypothetical protein